jgi:formamidopyrimidine-DNA glycosylase
MPELGDVEGFRRLIARFEGATIERIDVRDRGILRNRSSEQFVDALVGRKIGRAARTGKWLRVPIGDVTVLLHFGMTGALVTDGAGLHRHDRVVFTTDAGAFRFRDLRKLRGIYVANTAAEVDQIVGPLGADALTISADHLRDRLQPGRSSIKAALIDQSRVAGIGNFLSDEIVWRAGIDPRTRTASMTDEQWARLHGSLRAVVRAVARAGHTPRTRQWLTGARQREPAMCPTCGSALDHGVVAGRSSMWCPVCQGTD